MGILRELKNKGVIEEATNALLAGRSVFVARLTGAPSIQGMPSGLPDISDAIDAIERAGWYLADLTGADTTDAKRNVVIALFRKRQTA